MALFTVPNLFTLSGGKITDTTKELLGDVVHVSACEVRPHPWRVRLILLKWLLLNRFSRNLLSGSITKICRYIPYKITSFASRPTSVCARWENQVLRIKVPEMHGTYISSFVCLFPLVFTVFVFLNKTM